jgi:hypothetical protein
MKDETIIFAGIVAGVGIWALQKPVSDLTKPTGEILGLIPEAYHDTEDFINKFTKTSGDILNNAGLALLEMQRQTENRIKSLFDGRNKHKDDILPNLSPVIYNPNKNVYTNPKIPRSNFSVSSASQAIAVYQNPNIRNIATNLGNGNVALIPKAISLPPSLLSQVIAKQSPKETLYYQSLSI